MLLYEQFRLYVARWHGSGAYTGRPESTHRTFPNPSQGKFTIQSSLNSKSESVEIYNVMGQKVYPAGIRISHVPSILATSCRNYPATPHIKAKHDFSLVCYICSVIPKPIIDTIKSTVHSIIPGARIILFGSMANGTADKHSDYDLLVISKANIPGQEKGGWRSKLDRALVYALDAPVDIVLNSEEEVERKKNLLGNVVRWAVNEGVEL